VPQRTLREAIALAIEHQRAGRYAQAAEIWPEVVAADPNNGPVLRLFGEALIACGRLAEGADLLRRAIALNPELPVYNTLGHTLLRLGRIDDAIEIFRAATQRNPQDFLGFTNLGTALMLDGRSDEAAVALRTATELNSDDAMSWSTLALALGSSRKFDEGIAAARKAVAVEPQAVSSLLALSALLAGAGELDAAESAARQAFALAPDHPGSAVNLGGVLLDRGAHDAAAELLEKAILLAPDFADAHINLGKLRRELGEIDAAISHYQRAIQLAAANPAAHSALLMALHYRPIDPAALLAAHRDWEQRYAAALTARRQPPGNWLDPGRRLRIGYVSSDFREHPIRYFVQPLIEAHDRRHFEIFCYSGAARHDNVTKQIMEHADHWQEIAGLRDQQFVDLVRDHEIDILIDLALHSGGGRLLAMAAQPAPIQMSYLGYCSTTGMSYIDWRITDDLVDPPGVTASYYTERLLCLPGGFCCYQPPVEAGPIARREDQRITFGSFNNLAKISEQQVLLWCQILQRVEDSRLFIQARGADQMSFQQRLTEMLAANGIRADRVEFHGSQPLADYLQAISHVDIALDTYPFNGHTTTCHCLWMGVPVVSFYGAMPVSRVGLGLLTQLQMTELVASEPARYVDIAVALAYDGERRLGLRRDLRERMRRSPLMDRRRLARELEDGFRTVWARWCDS
jgi:predicted O-linked N-acetylglucosamine transferase (SPINDLY family)